MKVAKFFGGALVLSMLLTVGAAFADWGVGHKAEIEWKGKWFPATILETRDGKYKVHYDGYEDKWDEWVSAERLRVVGGWKRGHVVEVEQHGSWHKATVIEEGADKWKVHFEGWGADKDEWVSYARIRRL